MRVRKAVIPAAGLGTRFLPATKAQPKEMLPLVDKPIIQYVVEEAVASGIEDILIVTGRGKRAIEDHFDRAMELERALESGHKERLLGDLKDIANLADIHFIRQKEALGLGHAVLQARRHVGNEPFAVLLGDEVFRGGTPCLKQLLDHHATTGGSVIAVRPVPRDQVNRYGVIQPMVRNLPGVPGERGNLLAVADLVEKPSSSDAPSNLAVVGRYVLDPAIFDILAAVAPGVGGEIQLTDALRQMVRRLPLHGCLVTGRRYDVGDKLGFLQATVELALERADLGDAFKEYLVELVSELGAAGPEARVAGASGIEVCAS